MTRMEQINADMMLCSWIKLRNADDTDGADKRGCLLQTCTLLCRIVTKVFFSTSNNKSNKCCLVITLKKNGRRPGAPILRATGFSLYLLAAKAKAGFFAHRQPVETLAGSVTDVEPDFGGITIGKNALLAAAERGGLCKFCVVYHTGVFCTINVKANK
jgi:hypothetical protein